jgi:phosphomethylpyrimidine synthase
LVQRAREAGVQVMVEVPGHVPYDQIADNMKRQETLCDGAPFYVLGPLVTDAFPGYDHITSAIGATAAAVHGASFLCYVTPKEHLGLPTAEDVKAGCIAYKIAAHAADVARGLPGARDWDDRISAARARFDWSAVFAEAFDGQTARAMKQATTAGGEDYCGMCGKEWCALRLSRQVKTELESAPARRD